MAGSLIENSIDKKPSSKTPKSRSLNRFILPVVITLIFVIWKVLNNSLGILNPPQWIDDWGESMLVLSLGLWFLYLFTPNITRFSRAHKWVKSGVPLALLVILNCYSIDPTKNWDTELLALHAYTLLSICYLVK